MATNRQAEREAQARAWMKEHGVWLDVAPWDRVTAAALADLLAATERAVWEEAEAIVDQHRIGFASDDETLTTIINELRQRAQEVKGE